MRALFLLIIPTIVFAQHSIVKGVILNLEGINQRPDCIAPLTGYVHVTENVPYICDGEQWGRAAIDTDGDGYVDRIDIDDHDNAQGIANLLASNIKDGITILGVEGTYPSTEDRSFAPVVRCGNTYCRVLNWTGASFKYCIAVGFDEVVTTSEESRASSIPAATSDAATSDGRPGWITVPYALNSRTVYTSITCRRKVF